MPLRPKTWLPCVADILFLSLLAGLTLGPLAPLLLRDADALWHIRNGQHMLATWQFPYHDWFSATHFGQPWIAWEWLWDLLVGGLARFGLNGPVWLSAVVVASTFAMLFRALLRRSQSLPWSLSLTLLGLCAASVHLLARPHLATWLLVLVFWLVLDDAANREFDAAPSAPQNASLRQGRRRLWLLVPLSALWANLHPGFVLGLALIALCLAVAIWRRLTDTPANRAVLPTKPLLRLLSFLLFFSAAASLLTPNGWKLYLHLYEYVTKAYFLHHVNELQSPDFHGFAQRCFALLLLVALIAIARRPSLLRAESIATLLFATALGLSASRNLPVAAILVSLAIAPSLRRSNSWLVRRLTPITRTELSKRRSWWPALGSVVLFALVMLDGKFGGRTVMASQMDTSVFPVTASDYIVRQQLPAPVFLPDRWSGVLIYRGDYGTEAVPLVAIDDRHDFYGEDYLSKYLGIVGLQPGWSKELENLGVNTLLLPANSVLAVALEDSANRAHGDSTSQVLGWQEVYRDQVAVIFVRQKSD